MSTGDENAALLDKLDELRCRYDALADRMNDPAVAANPDRLIPLTKEYSKLGRIIRPYQDYCKARNQITESRAIADDADQDHEMCELAREELDTLLERCDALLDQVKTALVSGDDAAVDSIIMEIRAGTGGDEAALFARNLFEMYKRFCDRHAFKIEILDLSPTDLGGLKEVVFNVKGHAVYTLLGYESGGHRVQRVPKTEAQGRIHTSAATVAVLPEVQDVQVQIDWDKDVIEHVSRAGGPGGQNVNKVASAIRLEHLPTGITVSMRDEKSQHKNRAKARRILATRIADRLAHAQQAERDAARRTMIGSGDRSQRVRTYNFPQNRVTDHRIGLDLYSLDRVMEGELDELVDALRQYDMADRLKNL